MRLPVAEMQKVSGEMKITDSTLRKSDSMCTPPPYTSGHPCMPMPWLKLLIRSDFFLNLPTQLYRSQSQPESERVED